MLHVTNQEGETPTSSPGPLCLALEGKAPWGLGWGDPGPETRFSEVPVIGWRRNMPGRGTWVNFCWVRAEGLSEPLAHYQAWLIIVYSVAKYRPHLSHFRAREDKGDREGIPPTHPIP